MKEMNLKTLIIVPCFNEQDSVLSLYDEFQQAVPHCDVIFVNDCSNDETLPVLRDNAIPHLNLPLNLGIGGAMQTGYRYAFEYDYDIAIQVDGDGQHDPGEIPILLALIEEGNTDIAIGSRFLEKKGFQSSRMRRMGISFLSNLIFCITGKMITDPTSGFRALNREAINLFSVDYAVDFPEPESNMLALRYGLRIREMPVRMRMRRGGVSSINAYKSIYYMLKVSISILLCAIWPRTLK
jgi:glycosyltransferase involved in cell wall biosynthesis